VEYIWGITVRKTLTAILLSLLTFAGSVAPVPALSTAAVQVVHA
jgi:hypothetical protein